MQTGPESAFKVKPAEREVWGPHWTGPRDLLYNREEHIASFKPSGESGQPVHVYVTAMPARFYTIRCGSATVKTGSDMDELARKIAGAMASGMLLVESA
jgi:hypothetical protein